MNIEVLFFTQIASIVGYIGAAFWLYKSLVSQKDAVIELLKNRIDILEKDIKGLETQSPDNLIESLSRRVGIAKEEIEALNKDGQKHKVEIKQKETELSSLSAKLDQLQTLLRDSDLVCPKCGALLTRRDYFTIRGYSSDGREAEADISYTDYECGYSIREDQSEPVSPCRATVSKP